MNSRMEHWENLNLQHVQESNARWSNFEGQLHNISDQIGSLGSTMNDLATMFQRWNPNAFQDPPSENDQA